MREIEMNKLLKNVKYALLAVLAVVLTLSFYPFAYVVSKIAPSKVRVSGLTILVGRPGKEIFGVGFGW
jgi:hypothetical protein